MAAGVFETRRWLMSFGYAPFLLHSMAAVIPANPAPTIMILIPDGSMSWSSNEEASEVLASLMNGAMVKSLS